MKDYSFLSSDNNSDKNNLFEYLNENYPHILDSIKNEGYYLEYLQVDKYIKL